MSSENYKDFIGQIGKRIRAYRKIKGQSLSDFGKPFHKSLNAIKNYEIGPQSGR